MTVIQRITRVVVVCLLAGRNLSAEPGRPGPIAVSALRETSLRCAAAAARESFPVAQAFVSASPESLVVGQPLSAAMHPTAKGALIGAAVGVGAASAFGWWYCTAGPGECSGENWARVIPVSLAIGAAAGAPIGALR